MMEVVTVVSQALDCSVSMVKERGEEAASYKGEDLLSLVHIKTLAIANDGKGNRGQRTRQFNVVLEK